MRLAAALALALAFTAAPAAAGTLEIRSDARVDLVGVVQQLAGDAPVQRSPRVAAALKRFSPFKDHEAVRLLKQMRGTGFAENIPANYAVYLTPPPELAEAYPAPEFFADAAGSRARLDAFRAALRRFAADTDFVAWRSSQPALTTDLEAAFALGAGGAELEKPLVDALGVRTWERWLAIPSAFYRRGATSAWVIEEKRGLPIVAVVVGPDWKRGRPSFGEPADAAVAVWPEAAFSAVYAAYELCRPSVAAAREYCGKAADEEDCVEALWVRSIVRRVLARTFGEPAAARRKLEPPGPWIPELEAAFSAHEALGPSGPDLVEDAQRLLSPLQAPGRAASCPLVARARFAEPAYRRRLRYYLEARLASRPDPNLSSVVAELSK